MNLQEFINYHEFCPLCETKLITCFHSTRRQLMQYKDNRITITMALESLKRHQKSYKVSYCFGLTDQSLRIEFSDVWDNDRFYKEVPEFLRTRFLNLHNNLKTFKFFRECSHCKCYRYDSNYFGIDLRHATFSPLTVGTETIGLSHPLPEGYRIYFLHNTYVGINKTSLTFYKGDFASEAEIRSRSYSYNKSDRLDLPLIPFTSKEETIKRLNNLLIFT